jgi:hypothetical protein
MMRRFTSKIFSNAFTIANGHTQVLAIYPRQHTRLFTPDPGWTPRLRDIGRQLGITAFGAGRMLELLGYRSNKCITDSVIEAGFGVPRWNGFTMQNDWHLDRVLAAIRTAVPGYRESGNR